jgi:hypothetical protein
MFSDDGCPRVTKTAEKRGARRHQDVPTSREVLEERERERARARTRVRAIREFATCRSGTFSVQFPAVDFSLVEKKTQAWK